MVEFTASREDFNLYLTCPRKLALRTIGVKVREVTHLPKLKPTYAIGLSGEELTEQILQIIASFQADKDEGEHVEVYKERSELVISSMEKLVESLRMSKSIEPKLVEDIVKPTIEGAFNKISEKFPLHEVQEYKEKLKSEMIKGFKSLLGEMLEKLPKIVAVYKPTLRNRDTCSLGYPDYQIETIKGHVLLEVKNLKDLDKALHEGEHNLLYYNSLLADLELGDSTWWHSKLPNPVKSLLIIPRWGGVREIMETIPNFREIAVEIWKVKRAALVNGVLPNTKPVSSICARCQYKRFCEKIKAEQVGIAKPMPLIYALARYETEGISLPRFETPQGFFQAYFKLKKKIEGGDEEAKIIIDKMEQYLNWLSTKRLEEEAKALYRAMPDEFDNWGGLKFLKENYLKIANVASRLYSPHEENLEIVLKVAKMKWKI